MSNNNNMNNSRSNKSSYNSKSNKKDCNNNINTSNRKLRLEIIKREPYNSYYMIMMIMKVSTLLLNMIKIINNT